jgi:hypothetical protein
MSSIFHRQIVQPMPEAARGEGVYLVGRDGKRYLDASGGAAVSCLGHNDPEIIAAIKNQLDALEYAHTSFFTSEPAERLADWLGTHAPGQLVKVCFANGGSEAVEIAVKLARQYFVERGEPQRRHVIARRQSYHGNTLATLAFGDNTARKKVYGPLAPETTHISPCFAYRGRRDGESEEEYGLRVANELDAAVVGLGPDKVIAFLAETVAGATVGAVAPVPRYFRRIREICDRHGILLILDEVMCGMGRTGTLHACDQEGVVPDILVVAKGLAGGYMPIGAAIAAQHIHDAIAAGSGTLLQAHTFMGHPVACAAGLAVVGAIERRGLLARVRTRGDYLAAALAERFGNHRHVGDIRGRGLFQAIELVSERATKRPFDPTRRLHQHIKAEAMERGLLCYPGGGTADGVGGDHVLLAPPYIVTEAQIDEIVDRLGDAVDAALP